MTKLSLNLKTVLFQFDGIKLNLLRVANPDELVEQLSDEEFNKDERLPYWAELWPSAIGLSRFLIKNPDLIQGKKILELGCGLGLTSMILIRNEPLEFVCTDYDNNALQITRKNFLKNKLKLPDLRYLDWRNPDLDKCFDCIVASDILYEKRFFKPISDLLKHHLKKNGLAIIAEPNRKIAIPFFKMLKNMGFRYTIQFEDVLQGEQTIVVSIYLIERN
jgi:ETFB lysine methyltransferase